MQSYVQEAENQPKIYVPRSDPLLSRAVFVYLGRQGRLFCHKQIPGRLVYCIVLNMFRDCADRDYCEQHFLK